MRFEDISEFRASAEAFEDTGRYTTLTPGTSSWRNFWKEEKRRCLEGYHIGRDYIPGYLYDYLNYSPILITQATDDKFDKSKNRVQADRIEGFPNFTDGLYDYGHYMDEAEKSGEHSLLIGSRGVGKSFFNASMGCRNYFHIRKSKSFYIAGYKQYLKGDGILPKVWSIMNFRDMHTPWGKLRQYKDTDEHRRASKMVYQNGMKIESGYMSEIIGFTVGDDIEKLRGIRGKLVVLEEVGNFMYLMDAWRILRPSMQDGQNVFGLISAVGTGGEEGAAFEGAEELFRNPTAYQIHPIKNTWEVGMETQDIGFFWPAHISRSGYYDKNGNSDKEGAKKAILEDRELTKKGGDPFAATKQAAELPLTPSEALMRISGSQFPIKALRAQEAEIETKPHIYRNADFIGRLELNVTTQQYNFVLDHTVNPIYKFPISDNKNLPGAIVIHAHPIEGMPFGRYIMGVDSYDFNESTTTSLGSCYVMDTWTKKIVAHFTGRPKSEEFYETVRRLSHYYAARINIEGLNKGIFDYLDKMGDGWRICDEPRVAREQLSDPYQKGTPRRGTTPNPKVNEYARGQIAEWLLTKTNNPDKPEEMFIHTLRDIALVKEMVHWNDKGNYDRVSALGMCMILLKEQEKYNSESSIDLKPVLRDKHFQKVFSKHPRFRKYLQDHE